MEILYIVIALLILYPLLLVGRRGEPKLDALRSFRYAHRGLHGPNVPENSMAAFRRALERGYGIELDVHLLKDGTLAVIHDSALKRVTGQEGNVEDLTREDLKRYRLLGTEETIPEFWQVLELYQGKAPMIIELKSFAGNHDALAEAVCRAMEGYEGLYCMESFDPYCVHWLRKNRPDIIRGQLSENFLRTGGPHPWIVRLIVSFYLENFLTRPDFIAHNFVDRRNLSCLLCRKLWGIQGVSWTIRNRQDLAATEKEGWIPIFEGFIPEEKR